MGLVDCTVLAIQAQTEFTTWSLILVIVVGLAGGGVRLWIEIFHMRRERDEKAAKRALQEAKRGAKEADG
jgi:hypothetical protein